MAAFAETGRMGSDAMNIRQGRRDISPEQLRRLINTFADSKAEDDQGIDSDDIFVRTSAFVELITRQENRSNTVVLGRKGDARQRCFAGLRPIYDAQSLMSSFQARVTCSI